MNNDPFEVVENACGAVVIILLLLALYTTGTEVESDAPADRYATAASSVEPPPATSLEH
jgi:hypothetical protein